MKPVNAKVAVSGVRTLWLQLYYNLLQTQDNLTRMICLRISEKLTYLGLISAKTDFRMLS